MPILADDDVVVHGDAERAGDVDDRLRHLDVGLRRRRIAGGITPHVLRHSFASVANDLGFTEVTIAALVGHAKGSVTSKYIHTLDTALIMAADTISGYIQGLLDGIEFKQTAYAVDRDSRKAALARFLKRASGGDQEATEEKRRLAA
jgi:Phage integrase family